MSTCTEDLGCDFVQSLTRYTRCASVWAPRTQYPQHRAHGCSSGEVVLEVKEQEHRVGVRSHRAQERVNSYIRLQRGEGGKVREERETLDDKRKREVQSQTLCAHRHGYCLLSSVQQLNALA